jgi:RND family efflux transporter MFP subunit
VAVASKILAKVVAVNFKAGDRVTKDEVLIKLDETDLKARLEQVKATVTAARAARDQAKVEDDRTQALFKQGSAARIEKDRVETAFKAAEANLLQAEEALKEAQAVLDYATIRAGINGVVVDKRVDVGDMISPGQVLLNLYDPTRMQMVASVRESLASRLKVGQSIEVTVPAVGHPCQGLVSEIVPQAESASRTFLVKVSGPCPPGVISGMFGRLSIPLDEEEVVVVPREAVRRVGQIDVVDVADGGVLQRRAVQLGRTFDGKVEVLSGLRAGEQVAMGA